jgi:hypothetical protein
MRMFAKVAESLSFAIAAKQFHLSTAIVKFRHPYFNSGSMQHIFSTQLRPVNGPARRDISWIYASGTKRRW